MQASQSATQALDIALIIVRNEFSKLPDDGDAISEKVCNKLKTTFEKPPTAEFEAIIHKNFSDDEVRVVLFNPSIDQAWFYVAILQVGAAVPVHHNFRKLMSLALSLIFMIHRKSWDFVQEFVLAGGLEPLVGLLTDTNLYERSQALETLLTVTDCDVFDWFIPPPNHTKHSSHTVQQMHHQLLNLGTIPFFLDNIVKNRTETYPGGSFRALQLLAFWLSWVRALYTKDQKLALSRKLLEDIRLWGLASEFPKEDIEEEKKLAQTLLEDFGGSASDDSNSSGLQGVSFPTISSSNTSAGGTALEQWKSIGIDQVILNDNKNPDTSTITMERILSIKEEGNKLYKKSEFDRALHYYQQALYQITQLDVQSSTDTLNDDNIELSLRSNIANTYWKLFVNNKSHSVDSSNSTSTSAEDNQAASYLAACELHCRAVLEKFPFHIKATYRLVSVLLTQKYPKLAYDLCFGVIQHLKSSGKAHKREDLELFERLKLKCTAAGIISGAVVDIAEWDVSVQHLKIFEALIKRNQLQDKVSVSKFYVDNLTNPTPSLSLGGKHISNTIQSISLNDIDEDYHGKALAAKKDSDASMLEKKVSVVEKPSDVKIKKKMKLSNEDKQHIQRLKVLSIKLSKEPTDNAVEEAKSVILRLVDNGAKINDIYPILMEESDLILWLSVINKDYAPSSLKIAEVLACHERIQSTMMMVKNEYGSLVESVAQHLQSSLSNDVLIKKSRKKHVEELLKTVC